MQMTNRVPDWLTPIAWAFIALAILTAVLIAADIYLRHHRRANVATELVWIGAALYLGPFALLAYRATRVEDVDSDAGSSVPAGRTAPTAVAGLPGGGASAVAHLIGVPLVLASGLTIAGIDLWVMILVIGALAMVLLFVYEQTAHHRGGRLTVAAAAGAAALTVLAFDIGMGGWMLLLHFNEYMPPATEASFWFLMQIGVVLGLLTGYPAVAWLVRRRETLTPA